MSVFFVFVPVFPQVPDGAEAVSLFGKPLERPKLDENLRHEFESRLKTSISEFEHDPTNIDKCVWVGRMMGYMGCYRDAILWYTVALKHFGPQAKILRHRGHRYITIRCFSQAVTDLQCASKLIENEIDEIEQDGVPNAFGLPISSLHSSVWYHLALALYLCGDFANALEACNSGIKASNNSDKFVSQSYWKYLTLLQLGSKEESQKFLNSLADSYDLKENFIYHHLLSVFSGSLQFEEISLNAHGSPEHPTLYYGFGMFCLAKNQHELAIQSFKSVLEGPNWQAFGYIAAEVELKRLDHKP